MQKVEKLPNGKYVIRGGFNLERDKDKIKAFAEQRIGERIGARQPIIEDSELLSKKPAEPQKVEKPVEIPVISVPVVAAPVEVPVEEPEPEIAEEIKPVSKKKRRR